jgi:hypothetical protein
MSLVIIEKLIKKSDDILNNPQITNILCVGLIIFVSLVLPNLKQNSIMNKLQNPPVKILLFLLIGYTIQNNFKLGLFMTIALVTSISIENKTNFDQQLIKTIIKDQQNKNELKQKFVKQ